MVRVQLFLGASLLSIAVASVAVGEGLASVEDPIMRVSADTVVDSSVDSGIGYGDAGVCGDACCPMDADCGCPSTTGCCFPWSVKAGVIFLNRDRADNPPSARVYGSTTGQTAPTQVFDMRDSDLGTAVGPDITLTRCFGECWDLEARFFQLDAWNDSNRFDQYARTSVTAYGVAADATSPVMAYSSQLYNVELNMRWKHFDRLPLLMGFRTLGLDEQFQIFTNGSIATPWAVTETNNGLYGLQIGMEPVLWDRGSRFRLDGTIKAGVYGNSVHQRTQFPMVGGELNSRLEGSASFVGEIGLIGSVQLNKYWSIRGGYEVMWLTNVALAPDQSATITYGASPFGVTDDHAIAFYYGATASIERRF